MLVRRLAERTDTLYELVVGPAKGLLTIYIDTTITTTITISMTITMYIISSHNSNSNGNGNSNSCGCVFQCRTKKPESDKRASKLLRICSSMLKTKTQRACNVLRMCSSALNYWGLAVTLARDTHVSIFMLLINVQISSCMIVYIKIVI